jgi:hypothetical protein
MEIDQISTICLISLYLAIGWKLLKTSGKILLCKLIASESCYAFSRTSLRESVMDGSNPNSKSLELLQKCNILFGAMLLLKQNKESNSSAIFRIKSLNKITHLPPKTKIMHNNWSSREKMLWQKFYHILLIWMTIFQFQYMNHTSSKEKHIMPNCNQLVTIPARTSLLPNCNQLVYQTDCIKPSIQGFPRVSKLIHGQNLNMVSWCETK